MKSWLAGLTFIALSVWGAVSAARQQPRYPIDAETRWATGAKQKPAGELKKEIDAGAAMMIIDVRAPGSFARETIPGAINVPFDQLEDYLKKLPKDTSLVFT